MSLINTIPENAKRLHPDSIKVSRIIGALASLMIVAAAVILTIISGNYWLLFILVAALFVFVITYVWSQKSYDYSYYWLSNEGLYIQSGVLWRKKTLIPQNRVQHSDVGQGPLQRKYKLAKLTVHTAGTRDASVDLNGVSHEVALQLRAELVEEGHADAV